ncbi:hypothetical protein BST61_g7746 [Cercospora zeina]
MASQQSHILIIGAGVIGLSNAVFLSEDGYKVTVIAAHVPGDESVEYTSPWAGAHWRTHATTSEPEICDWDVQTFREWNLWLEAEAKDPESLRSEIAMQDSIHYWDGDVIEEDLWWAGHVEGFRELGMDDGWVRVVNDEKEGKKNRGPKVKRAAFSRAHSLDAPGHLMYLQERARRAGAVIFQSRLPVQRGLEEALERAEGISRAIGRGSAVDVFVNCTGLGAGKLCGDEALFPIRGQTVLVKGEAKATRTRYHSGPNGKGDTSYCIPRPGTGTTILGGTKEVGNWSSEPDDAVTKRILERCSWMVPELLTGPDGGFEVISTQCGLRPGRRGGPRVEKEVIAGRKVVHSYGHAGAGYQNSVGSARKVMQLVEESIREARRGSKL